MSERKTSALKRDAKYSINPRALRKWQPQRLQLRFLYEVIHHALVQQEQQSETKDSFK
jgi:hypothetical protein